MSTKKQSKFVTDLIVTLVVGLFLVSACSPAVATPTPHGDPLAPTAEVFNPLDPSPTPSSSDLPLTCQVTDLNVQVSRELGYCFAYPKRFTVGTNSMLGIPAVQGSPIGSSAEPVSASFAIEASAYDPNKSLDQQVDEFLKSFSVIDPASFERSRLNVGGEPAIQVDQVPVQLSWRIVFVQHAGNLYRLMYWPVDVAEAKADIDELYQTTIGSFAFTDPEQVAVPTPEGSLQISLDTGSVASGYQIETVPAVSASSGAPYWEVLPEYARVSLQGYPVSDHSMQPQIFLYPVQDLASANEAAGKAAADLQALLQSQQAGEELPFLPLMNSKQVMHPQVQYLDFKSGKGVRYLTQFNQGIVKVNNDQLIYTFQGLTKDGKYYIAAVLPVAHPELPATQEVFATSEAELKGYPDYMAKTISWLEQQPAGSFSPGLGQLDAMLSSLEIK